MKKGLILIIITLSISSYVFSQKTNAEIGETELNGEEKVYTIVEQMPEFPGGQEGLFDYLRTNMKYPEGAKARGEEGKVIVRFVVNKQGEVIDAKIIKSISEELDNEALRVVNNMPNWKPATQDGVPVLISFNLPLNFKIPKSIECKKDVYTILGDMPKFKGNVEKLNAAFSVAMRLTEKELKTKGTFYIQVIIDCNGNPYGYKLLKGIQKTIDKRVLEVLEGLPEFKNWSAGSEKGEKVNCQYNIPVEINSGYFIFKTI